MGILANASEFKKVYQELESFKNLRQNDQDFFDDLFILLLFDDKAYTNKYLSTRLKIPISTLEKRLHRLEGADLIVRTVFKSQVGGVWQTNERVISLDPFTFSFMKMKSLEDRIKGARASVGLDLDPGKSPNVRRSPQEEEKNEGFIPHRIEVY